MTLYEKIKEYDIEEMATFLVGIKAGMMIGAERFVFMNHVDKEVKQMIETLSEEE
jgi:hypothetical protein